GQPASFTAAASGSPTPTVRWERSTDGGVSFSPIEGATATTYSIAATVTSDNGNQFRARFTNVAGEVTSKAATLTVRKAPAVTTEPALLTVQKVPAITKQPASVTVRSGEDAVFESTASGFPAPTDQWEVSTDGGGTWVPIQGATGNKLTVPAVQTSDDGDRYR